MSHECVSRAQTESAPGVKQDGRYVAECEKDFLGGCVLVPEDFSRGTMAEPEARTSTRKVASPSQLVDIFHYASKSDGIMIAVACACKVGYGVLGKPLP